METPLLMYCVIQCEGSALGASKSQPEELLSPDSDGSVPAPGVGTLRMRLTSSFQLNGFLCCFVSVGVSE